MSDSADRPIDGEEPTNERPMQQKILEEHLDETDFRIFLELNADGRLPDTELADRVGLSRTAVRRRRDNLVQEGVIDIHAVIVLQEANLSYANVHVVLDGTADSTSRDAFISRLIENDLIYSLDSCLHRYDLIASFWHSSMGELKNHIWSTFENEAVVEEYDIVPIVKTWKAWDKVLAAPTDSSYVD